MDRMTFSSPVKIAALLALLAAALVVPRAAMRPLMVDQEGAGRPAPGVVQAMADCEADPPALQALETAMGAALEKHPLTPGAADQAWRLHSLCKQGDWAYAFVKGYALSTGLALPAPSEVVLAQRSGDGWQVVLPHRGQTYNLGLSGAPEALLPDPAKALLAQPAAAANVRFADFALPFPGGSSAYVNWHWYWALDFSIGSAMGGAGTIRNAKAGVALFVKDSSTRECGDPPPDWYCWMAANTVVIQSAPNEFAWYMHLAPNSVPDWIVEGAYVPAGVDLGQEGKTGWAASPHLHFQVANWYACCDGEGDSRMPHWPFNNMGPVDFIEYAWAALPRQATSQNGAATQPVLPPPTTAPPVSEPAPQEPAAGPTPATVSAVSPAACPSPYTVQRGDWLVTIAERCEVTLAAMVAANPGIRPNLIYAGQPLNIPNGAPAVAPPAAPPAPVPTAAPAAASGACRGTHVVVRGENLFRLAFSCGLTTAQLAAFNGIGYPYTIYSGQVLKFP